MKSNRAKVVRACNLLAECRMANKLITARMITLAGAIAAIGPVAVPAGACARTAAPFNNCDKLFHHAVGAAAAALLACGDKPFFH